MVQVHVAADAFDDAHDIGMQSELCSRMGMKSMRRTHAVVVFEGGFEDQGVVAVLAGGFPAVAGRADLPVAVLFGAEQGGEAGAGGKIGPAEPVDGALAIDQGSGFAIADEGVVFDL